jgi:hypothetical protein
VKLDVVCLIEDEEAEEATVVEVSVEESEPTVGTLRVSTPCMLASDTLCAVPVEDDVVAAAHAQSSKSADCLHRISQLHVPQTPNRRSQKVERRSLVSECPLYMCHRRSRHSWSLPREAPCVTSGDLEDVADPAFHHGEER